MAKRLALAAMLFLGIASARNALSFAVLGGRTPDPLPGVFEQVIEEVKLLKPDIVMTTGDLIDGSQAGRDTIRAHWDTVLRLFQSTGADFHLAKGSEDVASAVAESVYYTRFGTAFYSFNTQGCHFLVIDNYRWDSAGAMPAGELAWLERDLAQWQGMRWKFVFMNRSYALAARRSGRPERLHDLFRRYGVQYVFSGLDHYYCRMNWDGIVYTQVGPTGSADMPFGSEARGAFQNYLYVTVDSAAVNIAVARPGGLLPANEVTWEDELQLDSIDRAGLSIQALSPFPSPSGRGAAGEGLVLADARGIDESLAVTVTDVTGDFLDGSCIWTRAGSNWRVEPETITIATGPGIGRTTRFRAKLAPGANPYPLPRLRLDYPFSGDRRYAISRLLPLRREVACRRATAPRLDGILKDACWKKAEAVTGFGAPDGRLSPVEPFVVYFARDDSMLYLATRCTESKIGLIRADAQARDSWASQDDYLRFVLEPNPDSAVYYELVINADGIVWDRRCWTEQGRRLRDQGWNGRWQIAHGQGTDFWTLEAAVPLSDFPGHASSWGLNLERHQARLDRTAVFQAPFSTDPGKLATLVFEK